jgi:hypothetical protein
VYRHTAALAGLALAVSSCVDIREYSGRWSGGPVDSSPALLSGFAAADRATLSLTSVNTDRFQGTLSTAAGTFQESILEPLPAAEADILSGLSFAGAVRVFVSFATPTDGAGDALVLTAFYPEDRIELRVLRGKPLPVYGIFDLRREAL